MNKLTLAGTALLSLASAPVFAASAADTDNPSGAYLGAGFGRFDLNVDSIHDVDNAIDATFRGRHDEAWKIFGGYRLNPFLSFEAAYIDFGNPRDRATTASGSDGRYQLKINGWSPAVVGTVPLGPVELFGKAGYYFYNTDLRVDFNAPNIRSSHSGSNFLWGGGIGMTFVDHLNVRAEYERVRTDVTKDLDALWLSAAWRF